MPTNFRHGGLPEHLFVTEDLTATGEEVRAAVVVRMSELYE